MRKITTGVILICMLVGSSLLFAGGGPNVSGAKLYIKQNDLEKAIGVLMKEIENVSTKKGSGSLNEDAWYLLGYIYARQGEYAKMGGLRQGLGVKAKIQRERRKNQQRHRLRISLPIWHRNDFKNCLGQGFQQRR
ncbi:tetratricopeptide repeat protein [candidate division KSB1 bacterium]|nr:tetratricopeptide repeat protein [candidate division KSB1 bacterium]